MFISPDTIRILLLALLIIEAVLAALYLRTRSLSILEYLGWGLLIVFVPLLGPFLVIAIRPGTAHAPSRSKPVQRPHREGLP
ncbi:MAG: hypothetical protein H6Q38_55 [Chloroflexi bacterium]|nr:hypothetical protein [Chloroflexota bacterium]